MAFGFFKRRSAAASGADWIIAGLGNPGKKYENTRHNVGFLALDHAAGLWGIDVRRSRFDALCGNGCVAGQSVVLLKPQTFMNLSGNSIQKAAAFYKVPAARILVLFDDVSLEPGVLRIRLEGSAGGHNGLKSIISHMGQGFPRIKIGVGGAPNPEYDLADWVLGKLTGPEGGKIRDRFGDVAAACELILRGEAKEAMSRYNGEGRP